MRGTILFLTIIAAGCGGGGDGTGGGGTGGGGGGDQPGRTGSNDDMAMSSGGTGGNGATDMAGAGGGAVDLAGSSASSAGFTIKNPSSHDLTAGSYSIDFILTHATPTPDIKRVDRIRVGWSGESRVAAFGCGSTPWTTDLQSSGVITMKLIVPATTQPYLAVLCGGGSGNFYLSGSMIGKWPKAGDTITFGFDGILADATPFAITADAPVL